MKEITDTCGVNISKVLHLLSECPKCRSLFAGERYGSIMIDRFFIVKTCHCGFEFKHDMREGKTVKEIKKAMDKVYTMKPKSNKSFPKLFQASKDK